MHSFNQRNTLVRNSGAGPAAGRQQKKTSNNNNGVVINPDCDCPKCCRATRSMRIGGVGDGAGKMTMPAAAKAKHNGPSSTNKPSSLGFKTKFFPSNNRKFDNGSDDDQEVEVNDGGGNRGDHIPDPGPPLRGRDVKEEKWPTKFLLTPRKIALTPPPPAQRQKNQTSGCSRLCPGPEAEDFQYTVTGGEPCCVYCRAKLVPLGTDSNGNWIPPVSISTPKPAPKLVNHKRPGIVEKARALQPVYSTPTCTYFYDEEEEQTQQNQEEQEYEYEYECEPQFDQDAGEEESMDVQMPMKRQQRSVPIRVEIRNRTRLQQQKSRVQCKSKAVQTGEDSNNNGNWILPTPKPTPTSLNRKRMTVNTNARACLAADSAPRRTQFHEEVEEDTPVDNVEQYQEQEEPYIDVGNQFENRKMESVKFQSHANSRRNENPDSTHILQQCRASNQAKLRPNGTNNNGEWIPSNSTPSSTPRLAPKLVNQRRATLLTKIQVARARQRVYSTPTKKACTYFREEVEEETPRGKEEQYQEEEQRSFDEGEHMQPQTEHHNSDTFRESTHVQQQRRIPCRARLAPNQSNNNNDQRNSLQDSTLSTPRVVPVQGTRKHTALITKARVLQPIYSTSTPTCTCVREGDTDDTPRKKEPCLVCQEQQRGEEPLEPQSGEEENEDENGEVETLIKPQSDSGPFRDHQSAIRSRFHLQPLECRRRRTPIASRYMEDLEARIRKSINIYVYRNGIGCMEPILVHIPPTRTQNMRAVMAVIQDRMKYPIGYARTLYKMDGSVVRHPCQLDLYEKYVVASSYQRSFKPVEYGRVRSPLLVLGSESKNIRVRSKRNSYQDWKRKWEMSGLGKCLLPPDDPRFIEHERQQREVIEKSHNNAKNCIPVNLCSICGLSPRLDLVQNSARDDCSNGDNGHNYNLKCKAKSYPNVSPATLYQHGTQTKSLDQLIQEQQQGIKRI